MFQRGHYLQLIIKPKNDTPYVLPVKAGVRCINEQATEVFRIPVFFLTRTSSEKKWNDLCGRYSYTSTSLFFSGIETTGSKPPLLRHPAGKGVFR